ncbi:uncharacterized protein LOC144873453 isoform X4 [Branchiostoma floridae x Branchiostoma japonicum]
MAMAGMNPGHMAGNQPWNQAPSGPWGTVTLNIDNTFMPTGTTIAQFYASNPMNKALTRAAVRTVIERQVSGGRNPEVASITVGGKVLVEVLFKTEEGWKYFKRIQDSGRLRLGLEDELRKINFPGTKPYPGSPQAASASKYKRYPGISIHFEPLQHPAAAASSMPQLSLTPPTPATAPAQPAYPSVPFSSYGSMPSLQHGSSPPHHSSFLPTQPSVDSRRSSVDTLPFAISSAKSSPPEDSAQRTSLSSHDSLRSSSLSPFIMAGSPPGSLHSGMTSMRSTTGSYSPTKSSEFGSSLHSTSPFVGSAPHGSSQFGGTASSGLLAISRSPPSDHGSLQLPFSASPLMGSSRRTSIDSVSLLQQSTGLPMSSLQSPPRTLPWQKPEEEVAGYILIRTLGSGSFGEVWLGRNRKDWKQYAMKRVSMVERSEDEREAALRESEVLRDLKHPNLVGYKEAFEQFGYLYVVMNYCDGGDLFTRLKGQSGRPLEEPVLVEWFVQIAMAIQYLHNHNIIHRNLTTRNIFLTLRYRLLKVGDIGLPAVVDGTRSMAEKQKAMGLPCYMSPESLAGRRHTNEADVWALGCCLYEMASLKHAFPFYDKDINNLALKIVKGKMGPLYNSYSRDLVDLIKDMLQIEPDQRPTVRTILRTKFIKKHVSKFLEESIRDSYGMRCDVRFPTSPAWDEYNQYRFPSPPSSPTPGDSEQSQEEDTPKKRVVTGPLVDMEVKTKETAKAQPFGAPVRVPPSSDPVEIPRKRAREEPPEETIDDDDDDIDNISQTSSEVELMRLTEEFLKEAEGPASPVPSPDLPPPPTPRSARIIAKEAPDLLKKWKAELDLDNDSFDPLASMGDDVIPNSDVNADSGEAEAELPPDNKQFVRQRRESTKSTKSTESDGPIIPETLTGDATSDRIAPLPVEQGLETLPNTENKESVKNDIGDTCTTDDIVFSDTNLSRTEENGDDEEHDVPSDEQRHASDEEPAITKVESQQNGEITKPEVHCQGDGQDTLSPMTSDEESAKTEEESQQNGETTKPEAHLPGDRQDTPSLKTSDEESAMIEVDAQQHGENEELEVDAERQDTISSSKTHNNDPAMVEPDSVDKEHLQSESEDDKSETVGVMMPNNPVDAVSDEESTTDPSQDLPAVLVPLLMVDEVFRQYILENKHGANLFGEPENTSNGESEKHKEGPPRDKEEEDIPASASPSDNYPLEDPQDQGSVVEPEDVEVSILMNGSGEEETEDKIQADTESFTEDEKDEDSTHKPREYMSYSSYVRKNLDHKVVDRGRSPPREKEGEDVWSPTRVVQRLSTKRSPSPASSAPPALPPPPKQPLLKSTREREKSSERRRQHEMEHSYAESSSRYSVEVKKPGRASPAVSSSRESDRASPYETQRARQDRASPAVSSSRESNRSSPHGTQGSPRARQGRSSPQMENEDSDPRRVSRDRHIASESGGKRDKQDRYSPLRRVEQEREDHTTEKHTRGRLSDSKSPARAVKVGEYSSKACKVSTKVQIYHAEEEEGPQRSPSQDSGLDSIEEQVTKLAQEYPAQPETNEPLNRSLQSPLTPTGDAYDWRMHVGGTLTLAERSGEFSEVVAQIEREEEEERATSTRQEKAHANRKGVNAASLKISLSSKSVTQKSMSQEFDNSKLRSRLSDVSRSRSEERLDQVPKVPKISEPRQVPYASPMVNRKVRKPRYEVEEGDAVVLKSTLESSVLTAADVIEWSYVKKRTYNRETVYQIQSSSKVAYGLFRGRVSIEGTAALRIFPAKPQDTGRYYCTARDVDGNESEGYLELIVEAVDKRRWSAPADMQPAADLTPTPTPPNTPVIDGSRSPNVEPAYPKPEQTSREMASPTVTTEMPRRSPHHKPSIILEEKEGSSSEEEQDKRSLSPPASVVSSLTGSATDLQLMIAMKEREREKEREKERDRDRRRQSPSPMGRRRESPSSPARRASPSPGRSSPLSSRGQSPEVRHAYTPMVTPPPIPAPPVGVYLTKASPREDFKVRGRSSGGSDKVISPTSPTKAFSKEAEYAPPVPPSPCPLRPVGRQEERRESPSSKWPHIVLSPPRNKSCIQVPQSGAFRHQQDV